MSMPKVAIVSGVLLCVLGIVGPIFSNMHGGTMSTALIPLYVGIAFILLGGISLAKPSLRKHMMHLLAMIALLGAIAAVVPIVIRWGAMKPMARISTSGMVVICVSTLWLCIRSFIAARRARGNVAG